MMKKWTGSQLLSTMDKANIQSKVRCEIHIPKDMPQARIDKLVATMHAQPTDIICVLAAEGRVELLFLSEGGEVLGDKTEAKEPVPTKRPQPKPEAKPEAKSEAEEPKKKANMLTP